MCIVYGDKAVRFSWFVVVASDLSVTCLYTALAAYKHDRVRLSKSECTDLVVTIERYSERIEVILTRHQTCTAKAKAVFLIPGLSRIMLPIHRPIFPIHCALL